MEIAPSCKYAEAYTRACKLRKEVESRGGIYAATNGDYTMPDGRVFSVYNWSGELKRLAYDAFGLRADIAVDLAEFKRQYRVR